MLTPCSDRLYLAGDSQEGTPLKAFGYAPSQEVPSFLGGCVLEVSCELILLRPNRQCFFTDFYVVRKCSSS